MAAIIKVFVLDNQLGNQAMGGGGVDKVDKWKVIGTSSRQVSKKIRENLLKHSSEN